MTVNGMKASLRVTVLKFGQMDAVTKATGTRANQSVKVSRLIRTEQQRKVNGKVVSFKSSLIFQPAVMRIYRMHLNRLIFLKLRLMVSKLLNQLVLVNLLLGLLRLVVAVVLVLGQD